jgi:hypothetical protein
VRWGSKGFPKEIEMLNNLKVVFTVSVPPLSTPLPHARGPGFRPLVRMEWPWAEIQADGAIEGPEDTFGKTDRPSSLSSLPSPSHSC